jgi:serine O-acetyltransferase
VHLPDPIADAIKGLASRIAALERAVSDAEGNGAGVRKLRPAASQAAIAPEPDAPINPSLGPNPAGG